MKSCTNCHFLAKETQIGDGQSLRFSLSKTDRELIQKDIHSIHEHYSLKCAKGVWDEGVDPSLKTDRDHIINKVDRKEFCFHFPVHEGMLFQAASELQKRQEEYKKHSRSNMYTRIGLYIAALGLIANAIMPIVNK